ncbi:MAG: helix-turn-helix transcriptional regulator [Paracoccaceae bacterium]
MNSAQMRMARAKLNLSQGEVAEAIGVSTNTLSAAESEKSSLSAENLHNLELFYSSRGIEFLDYDGVRQAPSGILTFKGRKGFRDFYDYQYEKLRKFGGDIWLYNGVSQNFIEALGADFLTIHKQRMEKIKNKFTYRVIVEEGDETAFGSAYAEYRTIPSDQFNDKTIFVFCGVLAIVDFSNELTVTAIEQQGVASSISQLMFNSWDKAHVIGA